MARSLQITCDGCGKARGESNHWWTAQCWLPSAGAKHFVLRLTPYRDTQIGGGNVKREDFCGQSCVLKFIAEQMGKAQ